MARQTTALLLLGALGVYWWHRTKTARLAAVAAGAGGEAQATAPGGAPGVLAGELAGQLTQYTRGTPVEYWQRTPAGSILVQTTAGALSDAAANVALGGTPDQFWRDPSVIEPPPGPLPGFTWRGALV